MALSKDLVAASASPIILTLLTKSDSYGYAIIEEVRKLSGGRLEWTDGMLYPILHRLEQKQLIQSYWQHAETGRRRKYYKITRTGEKELKQRQSEWTMIHEILNKTQEST